MRTLLTLLLLTLPAIAQAQRYRMDDPVPITERGGTPENLPVGCQFSPEDIEEWARNNMPAVREAMNVFESRGYVRVARADTAFNGCSSGWHGSAAMLAYMKPGAFIDSAHVVWPEIMVVTQLHPVSGEPATTISAGLLAYDGPNNQIFMADSLPQFAADASFDMTVRKGGTRSRIVAEGVWDDFQNPNSYLNRWVRCTGWGSMTCVLAALSMGGPNWTPAKISLIVSQPEIGFGLLTFCLLLSGVHCWGTMR